MFSSLKIRGIIIKRRKYGEADWILTVFTEELGKIEARAAGSRKTKGKLRGQLELFNLVKLELVRGKVWDIVIGAETLNAFIVLKAGLEKIFFAHFLAEFVDKLFPDYASDPKLYRIFRRIFLDLNQDFPPEEYVKKAIAGKLALLRHLGIMPRFDCCVLCGCILATGPFTLAEGGFYCPSCSARVKTGHQVDTQTFTLLNNKEVFLESGVADLEKADGVLAHFIALALPIPTKALDFLAIKFNKTQLAPQPLASLGDYGANKGANK